LTGTLIAIFFRGLSNFIQRKTKWKEGLCVAISIIGTLIIVAGIFWFIAAKVQQIAKLIETLPQTIDNAKEKLLISYPQKIQWIETSVCGTIFSINIRGVW